MRVASCLCSFAFAIYDLDASGEWLQNSSHKEIVAASGGTRHVRASLGCDHAARSASRIARAVGRSTALHRRATADSDE
jgi:hypothetical protein